MTPEQLLIPRYKVKARDTSGNFEIEDVFMQYLLGGPVWRKFIDGKWTDTTIHNPEKYPHLFKPLQWWEDRKLEEMPAYVKQEGMVDSRDKPIPDRVIKVDKHWANTATKPYGNYKVFSSSEDPHNHLYSQMYSDWQPATHEEYLTYINSKS